MAKSKAETFIGFSVKARKIILGADGIERQKKGIFLILTAVDLSENSFKKAIKFTETFACPLMICKGLSEALHIQGCKMVAITDKSLASAIVNSADENFQIYLGGNK